MCFSDKMGARVLQQVLNIVMCLRSYYPLYPPPLGACLDTSLGQALNMPCTPDIVLFPSDLAPFAKVVSCGGVPDQAAASSAASQKTVCINPGRLVKDKSGATYAWVQVRFLTVMQVGP
jgi:DNA polymerase alpha subunit B